MDNQILVFKINDNTSLRIRANKVVATCVWKNEDSGAVTTEIFVEGINDPITLTGDHSMEVWG